MSTSRDLGVLLFVTHQRSMESNPITDLKILLINYLERKCTVEEKRRLYDILLMPENEFSVKEILLQHLHDFDEASIESNVDFDSIYQRIITEIEENEEQEDEKLKTERKVRIIRIFKNIGKVAAVFIPAFFIGVIYMSLNGRGISTLGTKSFCEIKAPLGAKTEITLPDGSHVLLNAGSTIKYFSDFNISNRNLSLEGEAYFKVAKNKKIPLIVNAANINIRAVGTAFNVKAYKNEGLIETTLIEGIVEISKGEDKEDQSEKISLKPNQKAIYVKENNNLAVYSTNRNEKEKTDTKTATKEIYVKSIVSDKVDVAPIVAWTQDKLMFRGETLENICVKLNRKYDCTFEFENEGVKNLRFTGTLEDETLEQVLNVIKLISPIDYSINKKAVVIKENTKQASRYFKFMKSSKTNSLNQKRK
ncbi:MAG: FecR family protein [Bacteroidetes bacterium]|nr:FecR family protein [Bacteroidota bacterium]